MLGWPRPQETSSPRYPEDDNPSTVHVVANAIYFKGEWRDPFDKEDTVDREFPRLDGSSVEVPFLRTGPTSTSPATPGSRC